MWFFVDPIARNYVVVEDEYNFFLICGDYKLLYHGLYNNSFKPEFTIVIFIHYKPRIATCSG